MLDIKQCSLGYGWLEVPYSGIEYCWKGNVVKKDICGFYLLQS